jgi:hypothetical protein
MRRNTRIYIEQENKEWREGKQQDEKEEYDIDEENEE